MIARRDFIEGPWRAVPVLGITQILSWGTIFYTPVLIVPLIAAERGCGRFEWRVLDWNEPSIKFYESLGATLMPTWILVRMTGGAIATLAASH